MYGHPKVDYPLFCSITRVEVRWPWMLVSARVRFRQVRRQSHQIPGLLRSLFLVESPRTFLILSVWHREEGLLQFATSITTHHHAIRKMMRNARIVDGYPAIWSTQWKVWAVSNNLNWGCRDAWLPLTKETESEIRQPAVVLDVAQGGS
jgi:hypothetical protein